MSRTICERLGVVLGKVVGHTGDARVHVGAAQFLGGHILARGGLHQRRPAQKDRARALDDDGFVAHGRHVRAARRARPHDGRDLRDAGRAHDGLVMEDAAEVVHVGEDLVLHGQEGAARVDEIDARQPILQRHLLGAQVLLDRQREIGAALDGGIVGYDHALASFDAADAGDDARARCVAVVHLPRRQRREFEEGRAGIEQAVDAFAHEELALLRMALLGLVVAAAARLRQPVAQFDGQGLVVLGVGPKLGAGRVEPGFQNLHTPSLPNEWRLPQ